MKAKSKHRNKVMNEQSLVKQRTDTARRYLADHFVEPFSRLRSEVEEMMEDFPMRWPAPYPSNRLASLMPYPAIEMKENDEAYTVAVEVPGVKQDDIDLSIQQDMLVIKGEKRDEFEESHGDFSRSERVYGSFERRLRLPDDAKPDQISAASEDGVLTVTVPRDPESKNATRHIPIKKQSADG